MTISHLQQKAFVRKYNSEMAIKGYTKMNKIVTKIMLCFFKNGYIIQSARFSVY